MDVLVFLAWCLIKPLYLWLEGSKRKALCAGKMLGNRDTTTHVRRPKSSTKLLQEPPTFLLEIWLEHEINYSITHK
jgi:hypothetical protein